jgi:hypothetical protein
MLNVVPSAAAPEKWIVSRLTKLLRLKLPPNHCVSRPVNGGTAGSGASGAPLLSTFPATTVNVDVHRPSPALLMIECSTPLPVPWITTASAATHAGQPAACGLGAPTLGAGVPDGVLK